MKKFIKTNLLLLIAFAIMLSFVGCGDEYSNNGLHFKLPAYMEEKSYEYAPIAYGAPGVNFMAHVFLKDIISSELGLSADISARDYVDEFIEYNLEDVEEYDLAYENTQIAILSYIYRYNTEGLEDEFYYHYIVRTERALYIVTMDCKESMIDEYKPIFDQWASDIWVE